MPKDTYSALMLAVRANNLAAVKTMFEFGVNFKKILPNQQNMKDWAIYYKNQPLINYCKSINLSSKLPAGLTAEPH